MSRLYLGVDGGQSSTTALIADENGRIIGRGTGGPCNHVAAAEGRQKFRAAIGSCLQEACSEAGLEAARVHFAAACLGFSGGAEDKESYARELIRSEQYKITHDAEIALSGATAGEPGIIVIAGTGSIAFGRNGRNVTARAGGWGYIFGDEGGAFDLVRQALRAALRFEEGWGPPTTLLRSLIAVTGNSSANQLLHRFYTEEFPRDRVARLAPLVTEAAAKGDEVARKILRFAAMELALLAQGVHGPLFGDGEVVPVCYIGGVFQSETVRFHFAEAVLGKTGCKVAAPHYSPAVGAVIEALYLDGNGSVLSGVPESEK